MREGRTVGQWSQCSHVSPLYSMSTFWMQDDGARERSLVEESCKALNGRDGFMRSLLCTHYYLHSPSRTVDKKKKKEKRDSLAIGVEAVPCGAGP